MLMNAECIEWLAAMFEADPKARDHYIRFPLYWEAGRGMGTKPWWPPLSEVWREGARIAATWSGGRAWEEAFAYLQARHAEYLRAKGGA